MRGVGDGEVGLARPRRPDAEHEIDPLQGAHVEALRRRARLDHAAPRGDLRLAVARSRLLARVADQPVEVARADLLALGDALVESLEHFARDAAGRLRAGQDDDVAVGVGIDAEPVLDQGKVGIEFAEKSGEQPVVLEGDDDALVGGGRLGGSARSGQRLPAKCCQTKSLLIAPANRPYP